MAEKRNENSIEPVQALERGLLIMELLAEKKSLSLNQLHHITGVGKASLLRLLYTLTVLGYAVKDENTGDYSPTLKYYEIGLRTVDHLDKMNQINQILTELNNTTGRIAQYSVEDNNTLLCLQSIDQSGNLLSSVFTSRGGRSPLYCTSAGKALLSTYNNSEVLEKFAKMDIRALTPHTITDPESLIADISATRQRGYALDMEENEPGLCCIGTIVLGQYGQPVGAVSLSGSVFRDESEIIELSKVLLDAVNRLSVMMGYINPMRF